MEALRISFDHLDLNGKTCRVGVTGSEAFAFHTRHTDPEFQAIVQGLEVSSPSFRAIFGVLFYGYDVSQGLRG